MSWKDFEAFYRDLESFEYPHKDKLLEFVKYFFLDHIASEDVVMMNYQAFKEYLSARRPAGASPEHASSPSALRARPRLSDSSTLSPQGAPPEEVLKRRLLAAGSDDEKLHEEERMLDVAEQCFMRIADLLHLHQKAVKQVFLRYS